MAEGVVVELEAVEVEEHEHQRAAVEGPWDRPLEVSRESSPVRQAGECVGERFVAE